MGIRSVFGKGHAHKDSEGIGAEDGVEELPSDRRHLLKVLGATAAGAVGASLLEASPAGATPGSAVLASETNTSNATTTISTTSGDALQGTTSDTAGHGVSGIDTSASGGVGVGAASANGVGLTTAGKIPIFLAPAATPGAPTSGGLAGMVFVDSNGVFYRCTVSGVPGTWVPIYSVVPLPAPVRVISTPSGPSNKGGLTGPFAPDGTTHTTTVLTGGATGIPATAVGLVGNLVLSGNGATLNGNGFLTLFPAGTPNPATSSLNAGGGAFATSNGVTVTLGTGGNAGQLSFSWQGGGGPLPCQVFLDVTAYIL
jgi:hypothetical protein